MLLEEGKSPVNATDNDGLTALHHAISEGHGDAAILLLKSGAEAEKRDADGRLAIDLVPDDKVSLFSAASFDLMHSSIVLHSDCQCF
jgi:26S proteasome non-ATPase regulatory subunit 10